MYTLILRDRHMSKRRQTYIKSLITRAIALDISNAFDKGCYTNFTRMEESSRLSIPSYPIVKSFLCMDIPYPDF